MKNFMMSCRFPVAILLCTLCLQGCLKDSATKTYTLLSPVYRSMAEVRAAIRSDVAVPVSKPGKIVLLGDYIFLNEIDKGVHVIDNSNPSTPINKYFIAIPGNLDLAIKGNTLYADLYSDLVAIDISNPAEATIKKIIKSVFPPRHYDMAMGHDTSRVIVDWVKKDTTVVVTDRPVSFPGIYYDSRSLAMASASLGPVGISGSTARFTVLDQFLYTVTNTSLQAYNISQPENPVFTSQKNLGWQIETISTFKGNLFIGSQTGVYIYSTANPAQPAQLSVFSHATMCDPVIADERYAYVTLHNGTTCRGTMNQLDILDISTLTNPKLVKTYPLTNPHGLSKDGNTLFICDGAAGLKVFDASDVNNIKLLQTISGIDAVDVISINRNAIVVTTDGLYQYDYSNTKNVVQRSKIVYKM